MRDAATWLIVLTSETPRIGQTLSHVMAAMLGNPATPPDLLFATADACAEAAMSLATDGLPRSLAGDYVYLARLFRIEAERPRPGFW